MSNRQAQKLVAIVLLVIAAILIVGVLGMWIMHSMMGGAMSGMMGDGMMGDGMMGSMGSCVMCMTGPLILAAVLAVPGCCCSAIAIQPKEKLNEESFNVQSNCHFRLSFRYRNKWERKTEDTDGTGGNRRKRLYAKLSKVAARRAHPSEVSKNNGCHVRQRDRLARF